VDIFSSIFLGILQGLTEFLPVSSSGHLVLAQHLIPGFSQPGVLFDVTLHAGTLLSIVIYFRKKILKISKNYLLLLAIGTVPAVVFGFLFRTVIEGFFLSTRLVGLALIATSVMNFLTDRAKSKRKTFSYQDSALVGLTQALAIIPGVSRSGSTIFTATSLGIKRREAAEFSFLLSVPAVLGANILQFLTYTKNAGLELDFYLFGFGAALVTGYLAIGATLRLLKEKRFKFFAFYCLGLGLLAFLL
jgi:undecaprenyl-diphosphatase